MEAVGKSVVSVAEARLEVLAGQLFPRWRTGAMWKVVVGRSPKLPMADGYCDGNARCIWVAPEIVEAGSTELDALLIHEVCHAVTGPYHGTRFTKRMRQAAAHADRLGWSALAAATRREADQYDTRPRQVAAIVYGAIRDAALEIDDFEVALNAVAARLGLAPDALERRFPRVRRVWEGERTICYRRRGEHG